jgi:hypothetical protein
MDEESKDVKEGEEQPVEPSATEEPTEEVTEPVEEEASETTEEETETVSEGKGANQRIRELNQKAKAAEAKAQSLEERIAELTGSVEPTDGKGYKPSTPEQTQYQPIVKPGEELTAEELDRRIQEREQRLLSQIDSRAELSRRQNDAINRHRNETSEVAELYPQLNPKSDQFDPELSEAVTEAVEAQLKAAPYTASVKKIVEKQMRPYLRSVANEVGKERENIAKQVSQSALRPTSVRKAEKTTGEKSIAELEAELGIVQA